MQYTRAVFPRMIIRYEDLIFHPKMVVKDLCECVQGEFIDSNFSFRVDNVKNHGEQNSSMLISMWKSTDSSRRVKGLTNDELLYSYKSVHTDLMSIFQYKRPKREGL